MFSGSEQYYDDIYSALGKDYALEADKVHNFIRAYKQASGNRLLDVACGTGAHAGILCSKYQVEGVDLNAGMLKVARKKHPGLRFFQGDMRTFDRGQQFDVVICLFSAIGYMTTKRDLQQAINNMGRHLLPGGVLLVEPWFSAEEWKPGRVSTQFVDQPDRKIVRMAVGGRRRNVSLLEFEYLIGTPKGIRHLREHHEFGLFTENEYKTAFTKAGLTVVHDSEGIFGRGLYIGTKPA